MKIKVAVIGAVLAVVFGLLGCPDPGVRHNNGGFGSFVAGTEVLTRSGLVPIEKITSGEEVYALDIESDQWSYRTVIEALKYEYSGTLVLVHAGGKTLEVTAAHPFLVGGTFTSDYRPHIKTSEKSAWLAAEQLKPGDLLLLKNDARAEVTDVRRTTGTKTVYDLNVGRDHTLAVGQQGFVVSDATITVQGVAYRGGGGGGGCFPAGTEVWTEAGPTAIETIGPGTKVYSFNPADRRWALRAVVQAQTHEYTGDMVTIACADTGIEATGNHPFWVLSGHGLSGRPAAMEVGYPERERPVKGRWLEARYLMPGDLLLAAGRRPLAVDSIVFTQADTTVYNLKVEEFHTYAVGAEGIVVHNKGKQEKGSSATPEAEIAAEPLKEQVLVVPPQEWNTEEYNRIREQPFLNALNNPLSTLSIDVDTASYSNVRRFLQGGELPPQDAVRIEEFINYFTYDYPEPMGESPFSFTVELSDCPWNQQHMLVHIGLQGKKIAFDRLPPNNLVFLLDVSGSMNSPDKLPLLKQALAMLTGQMRSTDRVSIVVYAGAAGLVLPPTPGNEKQRITSAMEKLQAGGSTAGGAGIQLAYSVAQRYFDPDGNNRVILATDGDFNVGVSSQGGLVRLIEAKRDTGIYLTVLGFGTGNYKDSRMESLADSGNGNYAYIDTEREARKALVVELGGTLFTIANDVKIQIEFNPAIVDSYRLVGYENRMLRTEDFADDRKDAGEMGAGHTVTVLYELKMSSGAEAARRELRYQSSAVREEAQISNEVMLIKFRYKKPGETQSRYLEQPIPFDPIAIAASSINYRYSAAVAAFAQILRDSDLKGTASYDLVLQLAEDSLGADREWYRKEFLGLVKTAQWIDR